MPQLKNRHEKKCLFPKFALQTYVPKRVCAFTHTQKHMHRVQLINITPSLFTLTYAPCCLKCRLSGVRSRRNVYGDIRECKQVNVCLCWVGVCMFACIPQYIFMQVYSNDDRELLNNQYIMQSGLLCIIAYMLLEHIVHQRQDVPYSILSSFF